MATSIDLALSQLDALIARLKGVETEDGTLQTEAPASESSAAAAVKAAEQPVSAAQTTEATPSTLAPSTPAPSTAAPAANGTLPDAQRLAQKQKKEAKAAAKAAAGPSKAEPPAAAEGPALFALANIRVGKVVRLDDIESEKLHKCQIDVGNGETKQIVAGLRKYYTPEQMLGRPVVVILNLKAAKLAGQLSEGMVLAADAPLAGQPDDTLVQCLEPPEGSSPGDPVYLEGGAPSDEPVKVLKSDLWKKLAALLTVQGGAATFDGTAMCTAKGRVALPAEMPDGASIH